MKRKSYYFLFAILFLWRPVICSGEYAGTLKDKIRALEKRNDILSIQLDTLSSRLVSYKNDKKIHCVQAYSYAQDGKLSAAIEEYQKALTYYPDDPDIYYNLGFLYFQEKHFAEAMKEFNKVLEINPQDKGARYYLWVIYTKHLEDKEKAKYYHQKFLENDPKQK